MSTVAFDGSIPRILYHFAVAPHSVEGELVIVWSAGRGSIAHEQPEDHRIRMEYCKPGIRAVPHFLRVHSNAPGNITLHKRGKFFITVFVQKLTVLPIFIIVINFKSYPKATLRVEDSLANGTSIEDLQMAVEVVLIKLTKIIKLLRTAFFTGKSRYIYVEMLNQVGHPSLQINAFTICN